MVSNDVSVRFTATELKLNAQQYKANRIDKKELYKGYREIKVSSDFINTFYSKKKVENTFDLYPNEFVIFIDESNSSKKAIGRYKVNSIISNVDSFGYIYLLDESIYPKSDLESSPKVIRPKNLGQKMLYDLLQDDNIKIITVTGMPGAGKTLLPVADAFEKVAEDKYKKFLYCKSVIPTDKSEEIGYFKGDMVDKLSHHLQGLYSSIEFLYENDIYSTKHKVDLNNLVDKLITSNTLELKPLATIRGASVQNRYILFDEAQNVNSYMMKAIITRVCDNCKLVIAGDLNQIDTKHLHKYNNGLAHLIAKGKDEPYVAHISLDINGKSARGDIATFGNKL
ncbi:MAG: PhoH family protein [Romboutsia sp.]|nr:PhoH family protein [Romboutsia sp.]